MFFIFIKYSCTNFFPKAYSLHFLYSECYEAFQVRMSKVPYITVPLSVDEQSHWRSLRMVILLISASPLLKVYSNSVPKCKQYFCCSTNAMWAQWVVVIVTKKTSHIWVGAMGSWQCITCSARMEYTSMTSLVMYIYIYIYIYTYILSYAEDIFLSCYQGNFAKTEMNWRITKFSPWRSNNPPDQTVTWHCSSLS